NGVYGYSAISIGTNANAGATYGIAMGQNTVVQQPGGVAIGTDSSGAGAVSTGVNQMVLGTGMHRYTAPGIATAWSRSFQSGPLEVVTSDAGGNLATDGGSIFRRLDEHTSGIALAMSMQNPDLVGPETFGIAGNV